ncbi:MAG: HD domain-containing protein [Calditrichaeota bacterium]|nr:MAG: HD domain-containing protein [Calditrichota bacterium]
MFFRKKAKEIVSLNLTAIDQKVIARKNQEIDAEFFENLLQMAAVKEQKMQAIVDLPVYQHLQLILEKPENRYLLKSAGTKKQLEDYLSAISLPELVIKELNWMQRFEYVYYHTLAVTLLVGVVSLEVFTGRDERLLAIGAALTHDLGITRVPRVILEKPGRLDEYEYRLIREHPNYSCILLTYYFREMEHAFAQTAVAHHEDGLGTGYPKGVIQENPTAQIIRLCDIYDALKTARPFRPAMSTEKALDILAEEVAAGKVNALYFDILHSLAGSQKSSVTGVS